MTEQAALTQAAHCGVCLCWEIEDNKNVTSVTRRRLFTFALWRKNCVNLLRLIVNKHVERVSPQETIFMQDGGEKY